MEDNLTLRYKGYLNTQRLWKGNSIADLDQIKFNYQSIRNFNSISVNEIRLGKLIEHFVFHDLKLNDTIDILASNIQIIDHKITIGEIDALIKYLNEYIHLEIVFKFYLYDPSIKGKEIDKWIGPNRNDSFVKKIEKIKTKQFPILEHQKTQTILKKMALNEFVFNQKVLFKAQLFVPFNLVNQTFELINNQCISGYYLRFREIIELTSSLFYIPNKLDWLVDPHRNVKWINKEEFIKSLTDQLELKRSPLCWCMGKDQIINKIFIVYW